MNKDNYDAKEFAALAYALAVTRGMLHSVLENDFDTVQLKRTLDGTSAANIAETISLTENDLAIDWNNYIIEDEKRLIQGRDKA